MLDYYTVKDIAKLLGVSKRSIQNYTDMGIIRPEVSYPKGKGKDRKYSHSNLFEFELLRRLLKAGLQLDQIRFVIQATWRNIQSANMNMPNDHRYFRDSTWLTVVSWEDHPVASIFFYPHNSIFDIELHLGSEPIMRSVFIGDLLEKYEGGK